MRPATIIKSFVAVFVFFGVVFLWGHIVYSREKVSVPKMPNKTSIAPRSVENADISPPVKTLRSKAGVVISVESGKILYAENAFEEFPVASLTKLMSGMVALDHGIKLQKVVSIPPDDYTIGGNLRIVAGRETVTVKDLFYASITGSANNAALAIAKLVDLSPDDFVSAMNRKAVEIKLEALHFQEPSGLSPKNTGTAYDVARMAGYAFSHYPLILDAASRKEYPIVTQNTKREHVIKNPDNLFERAEGQFTASKTGYLDEALYCLVLAKKTPSGMIVAVTLGNPDKNDGENETLALLQKGEILLAPNNNH